MADPKTGELMEKIVSLCKRRGFIFQSSEIYGGLNGFWDYGPLGAELKRNIKESWWRSLTQLRDDVVGLDASIIMHPRIWEASGHTSTFSDLMVDCLLTKKRFRADQVEPQSGIAYFYTGARDQAVWLPVIKRYPEDFREAVTDKIADVVRAQAEFYDSNHPGSKFDLDSAVDKLVKHVRGFEAEYKQQGGPSQADLLSAYKHYLSSFRTDTFSVLVPKGKPPESARKVAKLFYQQRGLENPELQGERSEPVKDSTRYNPENGSLLTEPRPFNLMLKTYVGPVESADNVAYLRPETAQAIFVQFKNAMEVSRQKVPFGICQIGKAFRNEINPRNFTFRSREFEQMELEFFIRPDEVVQKLTGSVAKLSDSTTVGLEPEPNWGWELWHKYWVEQRIRWYESIGLSRDTLVEYWQKKDELAHYAKATVDILYKFPFGTQELEGVAARGDFDLSQHQKFSGKSMEYFDEEAKAKYVPHVIEPSAGVDRLALALICNAYCEDQAPDEKGNMESRVVMKFHPRIAPIKVAVFPLLKNKPELVKKAKEVRDLLRPHVSVFYDEAGAIGRRYRRQDEAGTPFGVTIDFDTLGEKGPELQDTVTLRHRDSMKQERIKISELAGLLLEKIR
jgi:glycyl-tRNA synthetase